MDIENFRNFIAVVENGSYTGAAEKIHIAQPALSKQIKALETYYGAKLVISHRGSRSVNLTEAGKHFYERSKEICAMEETLIQELSSMEKDL